MKRRPEIAPVVAVWLALIAYGAAFWITLVWLAVAHGIEWSGLLALAWIAAAVLLALAAQLLSRPTRRFVGPRAGVEHRRGAPARVTQTGTAILADRLAAHDDAAFAELCEGYLPRLHAYLAVTLRDQHEAAGAVRETLVEVRRARARFDPGREPLDTWIFRIAHNVAITRLRRGSPTRLGEAPSGRRSVAAIRKSRTRPESISDPELLSLLEGLSLVQREVLVLRHWIGLDVDEVAAVLSCPAATAYSSEMRGLRKLAGRLGTGCARSGRIPATRVERRAMVTRRPVSTVLQRRRAALAFDY